MEMVQVTVSIFFFFMKSKNSAVFARKPWFLLILQIMSKNARLLALKNLEQ